MRNYSLLAVAACCALALVAPLSAADASRDEARKLLESAGQELLAAIDDVDEAQWSFHPPGRRHSIGELAEHASLSTNDLLRVVQKALDAGAAPDADSLTDGKVEVIREVMLDPDDPPDKFRAQGKLLTKADVLEFFPQAHRKALAMVDSVKSAEQAVFEHPSDKIGALNGMQWFYYIAFLTQSHTAQIKAIKEHPQYPKS